MSPLNEMSLSLHKPFEEDISAIRAATGEDTHRLVDTRKDFYQTQIAAGWLDAPSNVDEWVKQSTAGIICGPRNRVFIAENAEGMVGYVFAARKIVPNSRTPMIASIEEIYVDPQHRCRGLARRLFEAALISCRSSEVERVQLRILAENATGRTFWSSIGFREKIVICELEQAKQDKSIP